MGDRITAAARGERAREGLDVRVMFDTRSTGSSRGLWIQLERIWTHGPAPPGARRACAAGCVREAEMQAAEVLRGRTDSRSIEQLARGGGREVRGLAPSPTSSSIRKLGRRRATSVPGVGGRASRCSPIGRIDHRKLVDRRRRSGRSSAARTSGMEYLYERPFDPNGRRAGRKSGSSGTTSSIELEGPAVRTRAAPVPPSMGGLGRRAVRPRTELSWGGERDPRATPTFPALEAQKGSTAR